MRTTLISIMMISLMKFKKPGSKDAGLGTLVALLFFPFYLLYLPIKLLRLIFGKNR